MPTAWRPLLPLRLCLCLLLGLPGPAATDRPERPTGRFDQEPPKVLSLAITPTIIDVRQTAKMLETSVRVTDDFSGVAKVELEVAGRLGSDQTSLMRAASFQTGSRHDGYWKLKKQIAPLSANGTWRVSMLAVTDLQGNRRSYNTDEIAEITSAYVEVFSGLCFTSPWLCVDTASDPSSLAELTGYWALEKGTPHYTRHNGILQRYSEQGLLPEAGARNVKTLQELVQQDNEQDMKRNWLYEFYRRQWNSTTMSFPLKETGRL
jgi:hypothetical protein